MEQAMADRNQSDKWLDRITTEFVDDLFCTSDAEILAEAKEDGSLDTILKCVENDLTIASAFAGKAKMASARMALQKTKSERKATIGTSLSSQQIRAKLIAMAESFGLGSKLTMAARNGSGIPDQDLVGLIEDLADLGVDVGQFREKNSDSG
jgi:hypothetical protein